MNRIDKTFRKLRKAKKSAFIAFITAGYPSLKDTAKLILALDKAGADILELGVPFSDPMADGPVIQEASQFALKNKVNLPSILRVVKKARKATAMPICLMTYYNPVFCYGDAKFIRDASESGVDGLIIPDLPPEEGRELMACGRKRGLHTVLFISPTTSRRRMKFIAQKASGFIYYVSLTGVTGARRSLPADLTQNIKAIKSLTAKPVCVGFGVSSQKHVHSLSRVADGVIVGSAIVKVIRDNLGRPGMVKKVSAFAAQLKKGIA